MSTSRPITDISRIVAPRLTAATSSLIHHAPSRSPLLTISRNPSLNPFRPVSAFRTMHTTPAQTQITTSRRVAGQRHKRSRAPSLSLDIAPVRHNGVYVATFKPAKRVFSSTAVQMKDHHFDTLKFVQRLKGEGFSEEQAVAMMRVLNDVIEESIQNLTRTMVLKEDAERSTYTQKVDFAKLRSELGNADSTEAQLTRSSHERLGSDLAKLNARLRDEIGRTQASVRLDLNLEKGRIREEANGQEMRIKETEARIEQEVASLRERVEAVKFSTLQWLM